MGKRPFLKRKRQPAGREELGPPTVAKLLELLGSQVIDRFSRVGMSDLQALALAVSEPNEEDPAPNPSHPACAEFAASDYCRESWHLHLAQLKHRAETHWGTCQHRRICAMIPVVLEDRCLAAVKLAGPTPADDAEFKRLVEILELLVRDFVSAHADFLRRVPGGLSRLNAGAISPNASTTEVAEPSPTHPQVVRALEYLTAHLSDPRLSFGHVAAVLDICPTYLSELFVAQVGQRMSHFIARRRIDAAKHLLITTDWQIKKVARDTGYANPNWFCHVFAAHTGLTPGEYRAAARARATDTPDR